MRIASDATLLRQACRSRNGSVALGGILLCLALGCMDTARLYRGLTWSEGGAAGSASGPVFEASIDAVDRVIFIPFTGQGGAGGASPADPAPAVGGSLVGTWAALPSLICGDGVIDPEREECDDGPGNELDLCTRACQVSDALGEEQDLITVGDRVVVAWSHDRDAETGPDLCYRELSLDLAGWDDVALATSSALEGQVALAPLGASWRAALRASIDDGQETIEIEDIGQQVHWTVGPIAAAAFEDHPLRGALSLQRLRAQRPPEGVWLAKTVLCGDSWVSRRSGSRRKEMHDAKGG